MTQVKAGERIEPRTVTTIQTTTRRVPAVDGLTLLQFRRFAGCPVCNRNMHEVATRVPELTAAGITPIAFFHSTREKMLPYQGDLPFDVVADPERVYYAEFGVETMSARDMAVNGLNPKTWVMAARLVREAPSMKEAFGPGEKHLGLPADFVIDPSGLILAAHYGRAVDDHLSVDDVLALADRRRALRE